jgi:NitT/TauT family transport system substrate-binding protein
MHKLLIALCLALTATCSFAADTPVTVAHATWVGYGPLHIAKELGYFKEQGLDVNLTIIEDESQYAAALASGNIDGLGNVIDREVIHFAKGTPETVIFAMDESTGGDGVVAAGDIKAVADLKGRTVALDKSSTSYFFFLSILEKNGVKEDEVNIQEMGASDAGAAFVAGKVDAAVTWEPWLTNAGQREGGHVLMSSREMPGTIVDVFVMNDNFMAKHPEAPAKMARAWFKAIEWYKANPAKGDEIMAKAFGLSAAEVADMAKGVTFKGAAENLAFVKPGQGLYAVADRAIRFWKEKGIIEKDVTAADFVTDKFVVEGAK